MKRKFDPIYINIKKLRKIRKAAIRLKHSLHEWDNLWGLNENQSKVLELASELSRTFYDLTTQNMIVRDEKKPV